MASPLQRSRREAMFGHRSEKRPTLVWPGPFASDVGAVKKGTESERPIRCAAIRGGDPCDQSTVPPPVQPERAEQCVLLSRYAVRRRPDLAVASTLPETETEGVEMAPRGLTAASWD